MADLDYTGLKYKRNPETAHPFWGEDEVSENIKATASVDNTTGTPAVEVTQQGYNINFKFSGLKGETGAQGEPGTNGTDGKNGTDGTNGVSPIVKTNDTSASGALAGTVTGADGTVINIYNGEQGEKGADGSTTGVVTNVAVSNENGVYTITQTKDGTSSDVGQIEVPGIDNVIAEITDSIVETTSGNYQNDYHTIKETEHNGTQNDVGTFRIARNQITRLGTGGAFNMIDQQGNESESQIYGLETPIAMPQQAITHSLTIPSNKLFVVGLQGDITGTGQTEDGVETTIRGQGIFYIGLFSGSGNPIVAFNGENWGIYDDTNSQGSSGYVFFDTSQTMIVDGTLYVKCDILTFNGQYDPKPKTIQINTLTGDVFINEVTLS